MACNELSDGFSDRPSDRLSNGPVTGFLPQQRSTVASMMHRQETVECLKKFNARRKLKVNSGSGCAESPHITARTRGLGGLSMAS